MSPLIRKTSALSPAETNDAIGAFVVFGRVEFGKNGVAKVGEGAVVFIAGAFVEHLIVITVDAKLEGSKNDIP